MSVSGGLLVDRASQVEVIDNCLRPQVEVLFHQCNKFAFGSLAGAPRIDLNRDRGRYTNGVRNLDLRTVGKTCRDEVLRNPAGRVCTRAVYFRRVLAREGTSAVASAAAIGVDNNLSAGQPGVTDGSADNEAAGRVDEVFGVVVEQVSRDDLFDDVFPYVAIDLFGGGFGVVLCRYDDGVDPDRPVVLVVLNGHLAFRVGPQIADRTVAPDHRHSPGQLVCEGDRQGHEFGGLVRGVSDHHSLIASANLVGTCLAPDFDRFRHTGRDICRLLVQGDQHRAPVAVETVRRVVVSDFFYRFTDDFLNVDIGFGRDFAKHQYKAGCDRRFARHAAHGVLGENGVENTVGNLVGHLVGVAFGYRFRGEQVVIVDHF